MNDAAQVNEQWIERIVREVIARLRESDATTEAEQVRPTAGDSANDVVIPQRVVTLETLKNKLNGAKRVVVPTGAVITPAVRDELRERNVAIVFTGPDAAVTTAIPSGGLLVAAVATEFDPLAVVRGVVPNVERMTGSEMIAVVAAMSKAVGERKQLGLLVTGSTAPALCWANRHRGIRAVLGTSVTDVAEACESVGANLLIVNPKKHSLFEMRAMVREFTRIGNRVCPEPLKSILERTK